MDTKEGSMKNRTKLFRPKAPWLCAIAIKAVIMGGCNTLQSIEVSREPTRTVYEQGQKLDRPL
jgi:hypothetical protein